MSGADHPWIGVDAIITNEKGQILLIKRSDNSRTFPNTYGLVGGWMEWNETVQDAVKREVKEEIGVEIEIIKFLGKYFDKLGRHPTKTSIALPHLCKITSGTPTPNQPEEVKEVKWLSPSEIKNIDLAYDHKQMLEELGFLD